jgi:hypothetical protein
MLISMPECRSRAKGACDHRRVADTPALYDVVLKRLADARSRVSALAVSEDLKDALQARLVRLAAAARTDLTVTSREVDQFLVDLDAGVVPLHDSSN